MKKLILGLLLLATFTSHASELICEQLEGDGSQGFTVTAEIKGEFQVLGDNKAVFEQLDTQYQILEGGLGSEAWSRGTSVETDLANKENYRPRVYTGHMKFSYYVGSNSSEGFGDLDLIVPSEELTAAVSGSTFTSYLIMTYMDDHYGDTISLNCKIK
jgi:hypothetical protein